MTLTFDDLFALRIYHSDRYYEEKNIIKELKYDLRSNGMNMNDIDDYLYDFYKHFGIEMSKDFIKNINILPQPSININSLLQYMLDSLQPINNNENNENENDENNEDENNEDENNEDENNEDENIDPIEFAEIIDNLNSNDDSDISDVSTIFSSDEESEEENINNNSSYIDPMYTHGQELIPGVLINQLQQFINLQLNPLQNLSDVVVALDDKDLNNLQSFKSKIKQKDKCSICIDDMDKDEELIKLTCKHLFHKKCIQQWLKKYNYICPICRKECGKSKALV